jgi:hypothetical protein
LSSGGLAREVQICVPSGSSLMKYAGVEALWERFDAACEKAHAPAARHFAEQAAQHKQARKAARVHHRCCERVPALLGESPDWRAVERRCARSSRPRQGSGQREPAAWKKLDARLKQPWHRCTTR